MYGLIEPKLTAGKNNDPAQGNALFLAMEKTGLPVFLFATVFFLASFALTLILTPDRFPVRLNDKTVRVADLENEAKALHDHEAKLLENQSKLNLAAKSPVLHQIAKLKQDRMPIGEVMLKIDEIRRSFAYGGIDPIALPGVTFGHDSGQIRLSGTVNDPGGKSQYILTNFIDELREAGLKVSEPEYVQKKSEIGTMSPFSIFISLKN